jgi:hypothetical protein
MGLVMKTEAWLPEILAALGALAGLAREQGVMTEDEANEWAQAAGETFLRRAVTVAWVRRSVKGEE